MNFFSLFKRNFLYRLKSKINIDNHPDFKEKSIDDLFSYYNCDKANFINEGKNKSHGYSKFYEKHFHSLKNKKINILEIGSFAGASAASFAKYFPNATIYCLDINLTNFKFISKNMKIFGLDVSKKRMIRKFYQKINISHETEYFDIIIDDGSHKLSNIIISLNTFFRNLTPGGFYVLEEFKFPNYYPHQYDCSENKIDEILNCLKNKKKFSSNILNDEMIQYLLKFTDDIFQYRGLLNDSDISFIKKLN